MLAVMLLSYPLQQAIQSWSEVIMEQDKDEQLILNKLTDPQMVIIWNYCSGFQIITIHKHIFLESWQLFLHHAFFLLIEVERRNQKFHFKVFYTRFCRYEFNLNTSSIGRPCHCFHSRFFID